MRWSWDQGRAEYMEFRAIVAIAGVLSRFEGYPLSHSQEPLRQALHTATRLSFTSGPNEVWRNYRGVFGRLLLAARVKDKLVATELCHRLAEADEAQLTSDDFFSFLIPRFYVPSPTSAAYRTSGPRSYPFCAIIKYLLANRPQSESGVTIPELSAKLVGNGCDGTESIEQYAVLPDTGYLPSGDEERQLRELLRFFGQFTPLKWIRPRLFLDIADAGLSSTDLAAIAEPLQLQRLESPEEVLQLGSLDGWSPPAWRGTSDIPTENDIVVEGVRRSVLHTRVERSRRIRRLFFQRANAPPDCDMCLLDVRERYPWTANLLQVHHVLPLASTLYALDARTLLRDLVGLCPNCHGATHQFYAAWLGEHRCPDFESRDHAWEVYRLAKTECRMK
jgi:hypothetical protein